MNGGLPPGFQALTPFVDQWAVAESNSRRRARLTSDADERRLFYETAAPLLNAALEHLDTKDTDVLSPEDSRLLDLVLSLAHIALAVEQQKDHEAKHAKAHAHFTYDRAVSDLYHEEPTQSGTS